MEPWEVNEKEMPGAEKSRRGQWEELKDSNRTRDSLVGMPSSIKDPEMSEV